MLLKDLEVADSVCEESYAAPVLCRRCLKRSSPVFHQGTLSLCALRRSKG
jgi:hypothetical protein